MEGGADDAPLADDDAREQGTRAEEPATSQDGERSVAPTAAEDVAGGDGLDGIEEPAPRASAAMEETAREVLPATAMEWLRSGGAGTEFGG